MNRLLKLIFSTLSLVIVLFINYLSNTNLIGDKNVGDVSREYDTLITPAGYAFSIWGIIYFLLILFTAYQWYVFIKKSNLQLIDKIGFWFTLANLSNALWVWAWTSEMIGLSVIIMLVLLGSLIQLVMRLDLENWNAPFKLIFFVWWPLTIYLGWIVLATVLNISAFFVSLGWEGGLLSPTIWAIIMLIISTVIYFLLTFFRNLREAAMVGVWGLVAITYRQWESNQEVAIAALIAAGILFVYALYHAYKNRKYSVLNKE